MRFYSTASKATRFVPSSGTYPKGFTVGAIGCGIKKKGFDLALIKSETPCSAAGVFTTNKFQAAPVQVSRRVLKETSGKGIQSIIVNSGCANAVTGKQGYDDALEMIKLTDAAVGKVPESQLGSLVMSTGVIGQLLPMGKISAGISKLSSKSSNGSEHENWLEFARGIMTTDTFPKLVSHEVEYLGGKYSIVGVAKGAGMICPNMATLLGCVVTDLPISSSALQSILQHSVDRSFNSISVDGDMSTNDTIVALANGTGTVIDENNTDFARIRDQFSETAQRLAQLVVRDGEGATKFVTVHVKNSKSFASAKKVASSVANSMLVKTALYGKDANWGRILCSVGYTDLPDDEIAPEKISLRLIPADGSKPLDLYIKGTPEIVDEARASEILEFEDLTLEIDMAVGAEDAKFWTCDLSHEYVTINGDYRS